MRKQFKMLLLVAMILTLFVMAMLVSSASEAAPYVALNGETVVSEHPNFKAAFAVVKAGEADTIRLDADVTMNEAIEVDANVTIDGNGHTMTFSSTVRSGYLFNFKKEGMVATVKNLTLEDSMLKPTANRVSGLFFMQEDSVTLTVKNVIAEGHTGDIANCAKIEGVKCVSGTTITIDGCVMISDTSTISIQFSSNEIPDANGNKITKKNTVVIKNSTLEAQQTGNTGFTYLVNCDVVIESSAIKTGSMVFRVDKSQEPNTYKVVGDTRIEADMFAYTRGCGFEVVVGSPDDGPQPQIHVNTYLERWDQTIPGEWTVYGGTFTSETYFFRNGGKAANVLNIYGGTFIANNGQPIVRTEAVTVTPVVNIYGGEFHLSNGSQISVNTKKAAAPLGITLPATLPSGEAVAPGAIKVFLGEKAANDETTQKFFIENGWAAAGAHFIITAWDVDTSSMYEFTENFTGTFAEWKEKVGAVVYQAPITAYEVLRAKDSTDQIFFANQNLFVDIGVMPPFVIRKPEVTVTINGGSYDVNGLFAVVEGGNLVFTNCEINATTTLVELTGGKVTVENATIVATGNNPLIVVNGADAAVDLKGANTSITAENAIVSIENAACGTVTVNEGTYISTSGKFLFTATVNGLVDKINIVKATFRLGGGSVLADTKVTNDAFLLTPVAAGDITFYLDAGSADSVKLQEFLKADKWFAAGAYYRVIGWGAGEASVYEMTENFSGTLAEYKAMLHDYIMNAPQINYEALRSETDQQVFFTTGENTNLFVEYATIPEMLPFIIKDPNVTVTLTDWVYDANGLFARVEAGKLILNNCTINVAMVDGSFIVVNGAGATVDVNSGHYLGKAPVVFSVTTGTLNLKGGTFLNSIGNIVNVNGAGNVNFTPATADTVLRFYAGGSIVDASAAAGSAVTILGGEFHGNYVETEGQAPADVSMFYVGGNNAQLVIHGGSFDNQQGDYIFNLANAGAKVTIDGGTFDGGRGWINAAVAGTVEVKANADAEKNPVFKDTNKTAGSAYINVDGGATVVLYAGTYTAGKNEHHMLYVKSGTLSVAGGTYTGSLFYATTTSKISIIGGDFIAKGNGAVLFDFDGTLTANNLAILLDQEGSAGNPTFTVTDNAYIFDTSMDADTVSTLLTNANITVAGYAKVGLTFTGTEATDLTFASEADVKIFLDKYVANGTLTLEGVVPTFKINGKVNVTVSGGTWNYGSDYLFNLADGGATVTITGGTFNSVGGGVLYLGGKVASTVVIGNPTDARQAPRFNVTDGLAFIYDEAADSKITIKNGSFTGNDMSGFVGFRLAARAEVVVDGGTFTINKGSAVDKDGKVENNSVLFYAPKEGTTITINNGTFKAARIIYFTKSGTLTINDGSFSSNAFSIDSSYMIHAKGDGSIFNINGGTFRGNLYTKAIVLVNAEANAQLNIKGGNFSKGLTWVYVKGPHTVTFDKLEGGTGPVFEGLNDGVGADMSGGAPKDEDVRGIYFASGDAVCNFKAGTFKLLPADQCALFMLSEGTFTFEDGVVAQASYQMFCVDGTFDGTVTINGGTYTGIYIADMFYFAAAAQTEEPFLQGKYVINGGTFNAEDSSTLFHVASLDDKIEMVIKGGIFSSKEVRLAFFTAASVMKFTVEGGTFTTTAPRMFYLEENTEPLVIKGGEFILAEKSGNKADDGIIYSVSKKHSKVSIQGGTFVDERTGNNQTFTKIAPYGVVEFAGPFKIYTAEQKTNFYYDGDDNDKSVPFTQTKATYNEKEYYVCVAYYNQNAPVVQKAPALRPVMGAEGLTFTASVSAEVATHLATLGTVSYGTLIFPTKYMPNGWQDGADFLTELKAYATENNVSESSVYAMVDAVNGLVAAEDGSLTITASLVNIKDANHTLDITGIAYAKVTAEDGTVTYHYASHLSAGVTNNMRAAVKTALYDLQSTALDNGLHVYCYASIMKSNSFSRYSTPFQQSVKKYLAEADRAPQW